MIITYVISAVVLLGLCITVHELGHLLGGKMVGIKAKTFSIGYGKGFIKKKFGDTTYQITLIPFGGFCSFYGDTPGEALEGKEYEFLTAKPWRRMVTVAMGPLFNLIFGIILFFIMNIAGFYTETTKVMIPEPVEGIDFPSLKSGLQNGDIVREINGKKMHSFGDIQAEIAFSDGKPINIKYEREGKVTEVNVVPVKFDEKGYYSIGIYPYGNHVLIARISKGEAAEKAGLEVLDEISAVDGTQIESTKQFIEYIKTKGGQKVVLSVKRGDSSFAVELVPRVRETFTIQEFEDQRFKGDKFEIVSDKLDVIKKAVSSGKVKINGLIISDFDSFLKTIKENEGKEIIIENSGGIYKGKVRYEQNGFLGIYTATAPEMVEIKYEAGEALVKAFVDPMDFIVMNLKGIGMLFSGKLDVRENLSGPIRIAQIAGDTARYRGVSAFILLMAKISIILMVMNLLPIPAVDGSYLIFYTYETIKGKPISEGLMAKIQMFGFALIIMIGVFAVFNDLSRIEVIQNFFK